MSSTEETKGCWACGFDATIEYVTRERMPSAGELPVYAAHVPKGEPEGSALCVASGMVIPRSREGHGVR